MTHGWAGSVGDFLAVSPQVTARALSAAHRRQYGEVASPEQVHAWEHGLDSLAGSLKTVPGASDWSLIFEYELPCEGGRRPDVLLLAGDHVLVLELKERTGVSQADLDQVDAYARDLQDYHSECRSIPVTPVLFLPNRGSLQETVEGTSVVGPEHLATALKGAAGRGDNIDLQDWLSGTYAPLPTLVAAARRVFEHEPLPSIKRAESAGIPELLQWLQELVDQARLRRERHLVLITGVPGSGKTLVGLQFVHLSRGLEPEAIFLSGNDPLVTVLQDALQSKIFVRRMHDFDLEYGIRKRSLPIQHVFVFDEAQRAWDSERMSERKSHDRSEPEILLDVTGSVPDWGVAIGLVGEGQEIYLGEEAGLAQWEAAVQSSSSSFTVHVPPHLEAPFAAVHPQVNPRLNLTLSLRTHRAERVQEWVAAVIDGRVNDARAIGPELRDDGFDLYVTSDLLKAKRYLMHRYEDAPEKRFGLLASSKAGNLRPLGIDNEYQATMRLKIGPWFNAAPSHPLSSCQLAQPVTEFQCQGLELDMPIVCWGDDLGWVDEGWQSFRRTMKARDSHQLRLNSYRVLLTRGRDGVIVFVPDNLRTGQQRAIGGLFERAGVRIL